MNDVKLVTVTRKDITPGYQLVQTAHAIADFAHDHPDQFKQWKSESNSIITLAVDDEQSLISLFNKLKEITPHVIAFTEPDINDQTTALCVYGSPEIRKMLCHIPLALKERKPVTA